MQPTTYWISVGRRLPERLGSAFGEQADTSQTAQVGVIEDQSELFGLLDRVRDLGLELVSVQPPGPD